MSSAPGLRGARGAGEQNMTETDAFPMRRVKTEVFDMAETYKRDHKRRGIALIFNHERIFWHLTLPHKQGTSTDRDNLNFNILKEINCQHRILYLVKISFRNEGEITAIGKQKLKKFITKRPTLQEILHEVL
uniref:Caspase family p20 domain-containing protein n=1 Tax=Phocoena sinus TaxID=42100 RepID=A0A8C9EED5_PHOSS